MTRPIESILLFHCVERLWWAIVVKTIQYTFVGSIRCTYIYSIHICEMKILSWIECRTIEHTPVTTSKTINNLISINSLIECYNAIPECLKDEELQLHRVSGPIFVRRSITAYHKFKNLDKLCIILFKSCYSC